MSAPKQPETGRIAGIMTAAELVAAGFSDSRIATLVRRGDLHQAGRGVYADGPKARDMLKFPDGRRLLGLAGAAAAVGPAAIVSHQSAAYLHSIDLFAKRDQMTDLTVPVPRGRTASGCTRREFRRSR